MISDPSCPVCADRRWEILGERTYRADATAGWRPSAKRVLFDVWLKGEKEFRVKFAGCRTCGMMIYVPRPSLADMEAKFARNERVGDFLPSSDENERRTRQRARRLFGIIEPHLPRPVAECRVLDYGGGDGRLLAGFVAGGAACDVIDYCIHTVPGVRHVGQTEQDVDGEAQYDVVICNHVVEHLAEPLPVLRQLARALKPDGVIYVEVPVEVRKAMPAGKEPVTHVNFFIPESRAGGGRAGRVRGAAALLAALTRPSRTHQCDAVAKPAAARRRQAGPAPAPAGFVGASEASTMSVGTRPARLRQGFSRAGFAPAPAGLPALASQERNDQVAVSPGHGFAVRGTANLLHGGR
jgi:2-polyprenyl-3-methyl-5-hydroxy-6-metoxy-1,4-benzoquinol methylase